MTITLSGKMVFEVVLKSLQMGEYLGLSMWTLHVDIITSILTSRGERRI